MGGAYSIGAGLAGIFPLVLGASARTSGVVPGAAIAVVSMCGYSGLLAGPPLIGGVANTFTLRGGLALVMVASVVVVLLARVVGPRSPERRAHIAAPNADPASQRERAVAA